MKVAVITTMLSSCALLLSSLSVQAKRHKYLKTTNPEFFKTDIARQIGARILIYQRCTAGWPKNTDLVSAMSPEEVAKSNW